MRITDLGPGLTRRTLLGGLAFTALLPAAARALTVPEAQSLVVKISSELTQIVNSGRSGSQLYRAFEGVLARYGDMSAVGASVLGPPWRSASNAQRSAFVSAFQGYLARKYGRQFEDFSNARIEVRGGRSAGRAGVLVNTEVVRPGREDIAVDWQISDRSGAPKAVNLIIEGVSLLANERAEVGAMLDAQGGDLNGLIAQLQARS